MLSDALLAKIDKNATPSDAAAEGLARNIYKAKPETSKAPEQVQVRHILIAGTEGASRAQAEKTLEKWKGGADFATLAQERSADQGQRRQGWRFGPVRQGPHVLSLMKQPLRSKNRAS